MNPVKVRNVEIGTGIPKICVPIVGVTKEEIIEAAEKIKTTAADVVEWRVDWYEDIFDFGKTEDTMKALRETLGDMPILFTFRTSKEGGEKAIETEAYVELNQKAARTGLIDLVDVEAFTGDDAVKAVVETAHGCGVKVVASNHDFHKTPSQEEIVLRLRKMQDLGADIPRKTCLLFWPLQRRWRKSMQTVRLSPCPCQEQELSAVCAVKCLVLR